MTIQQLKKEMSQLADPKRAKNSLWFFKTAKGEYGEGDKFIGIDVRNQRRLAKKYKDLPLKDVALLLKSPIHEHRLTALFILIIQYNNGNDLIKKQIFNHYVKNTKYINNWDLIDSSASYILGDYLLDKSRDSLYKFARSKDLWKKRIAILATLAFIREKDFRDTLSISEILLKDKHDLIHKAVGWMLREVGNRERGVEEGFLKLHYKIMPRTMLRYSIEKFPEKERTSWLSR